MKIKTLLFLLYIGLTLTVKAQDKNAIEELAENINKIALDSALLHAQFAVSVRSVKDGTELIALNSRQSLSPASNMKVVSTAAALSLLGEDFTFQTLLSRDGEIIDGTLQGNLYIIGGGDPTLGCNRIKSNADLDALLKLFHEKLKENNIVKITGNIIADPSIFESNPLPDFWTWGDMGNYYGAGAEGININENTFSLSLKPGKTGELTSIIKTNPIIPKIEFLNHVTTGIPGSGDHASIYGSPFSNFRYLEGAIPGGSASFSIKGSIPDPSFLLSNALYKYIQSKGIEVKGKAKTLRLEKNTVQTERKTIFVQSSPALSEIVTQTNTYSLNLYAESLLKMLAYKSTGKGTTNGGIRVVKEYWKKKGLDTAGFFMYDGCGLSRFNAISASQLSQMLCIISKEPYFNSFYNSLPIAGVSGTIYKLCKGSSAENNLRAKSGTVTKVSCYTGYVKSKSGEMLSFSIMSNNFEGSNSAMVKKIEKIMILLADF